MHRPLRAALTAFVLALISCRSDGSSTSDSARERSAKWSLAWSDEFDGARGSPVNATKWVADTGGRGWGNDEREYYTPGTENAALDGAGHLVITARAEQGSRRRCWYGACRYTSARLKSAGRYETTYGRFEARIKLPRSQGLWPAFWLLGANCASTSWPQCGEIDVVESVGHEPDIVFGTLHGPGYSGDKGITMNDTLHAGTFADDFHVYAMEWAPGQIRWLVDEKEYHRLTPAQLPPGAAWVFDHPFFLILNVAVGGGRPGEPDATTIMPQEMVVDYVRVYQP